MWNICLKCLLFINCIFRFYYIWSKIYRFLFEHKFKNHPIPEYPKLTDLIAFIGTLKWKKDEWWMLGDAISYPGKVQWIAENTEDKAVGDCDEFGCYIAYAMNQMKGKHLNIINGPYLLSVMWKKDKYIGGHNVCVWEDSNGWHHMSNWNGGRVYNITGNIGRDLDPLYEVAKDVNGKRTLLGYMACDVNLKMKKWKVLW